MGKEANDVGFNVAFSIVSLSFCCNLVIEYEPGHSIP